MIQLRGSELERERLPHGLEVLDMRRADDDRGDLGDTEKPRNGEPRRGDATAEGLALERLERVEDAVGRVRGTTPGAGSCASRPGTGRHAGTCP